MHLHVPVYADKRVQDVGKETLERQRHKARGTTASASGAEGNHVQKLAV